MNNENQNVVVKKQTNIVIKILVVLLFILVGVVLGMKINGYFKDDRTYIEDDSNSATKDEEKNELKFSITDLTYDGIAITYNGEVYVNISGSNYFNTLYGNDAYTILNQTRNSKYQSYTFDEFSYINSSNHFEFRGLKLDAKNVKAVYSYNNAQTMPINAALILLHNNNTLSVISVYSLILGKTDTTKINNLNNIVDVNGKSLGMGGVATYAITSEGNEINLENYIPQDYLSF